MANQGNADIAERIENRIDQGLAGGIEIAGTGGSTNIVPRNMGELMEFAKMMSLAGMAVRPQFRHKPGDCLAVTLQAMRWGMCPFAVSNKAFAVNDQLGYESQLVHAVVNARAPLQGRLRPTYSGEGQGRRCTIAGLLKGETEPSLYESPAIGDIKPQNSPLWKTDPDQQLFYYSVRAWARRHVPEVLLGVYTEDEIGAREQHYGPDHAKDVTPPPRPTRRSAPVTEAAPAAEPEPDPEPEPEPETDEDDGESVPDFQFVDRYGEVGDMHHDPVTYSEAIIAEMSRCTVLTALVAVYEHNEESIVAAGEFMNEAQRQELTNVIRANYDKAKAGVAKAANDREKTAAPDGQEDLYDEASG